MRQANVPSTESEAIVSRRSLGSHHLMYFWCVLAKLTEFDILWCVNVVSRRRIVSWIITGLVVRMFHASCLYEVWLLGFSELFIGPVLRSRMRLLSHEMISSYRTNTGKPVNIRENIMNNSEETSKHEEYLFRCEHFTKSDLHISEHLSYWLWIDYCLTGFIFILSRRCPILTS